MTMPKMRPDFSSLVNVAERIALMNSTLCNHSNTVGPWSLYLMQPMPMNGDIRTGHIICYTDNYSIAQTHLKF